MGKSLVYNVMFNGYLMCLSNESVVFL